MVILIDEGAAPVQRDLDAGLNDCSYHGSRDIRRHYSCSIIGWNLRSFYPLTQAPRHTDGHRRGSQTYKIWKLDRYVQINSKKNSKPLFFLSQNLCNSWLRVGVTYLGANSRRIGEHQGTSSKVADLFAAKAGPIDVVALRRLRPGLRELMSGLGKGIRWSFL
ncbi:MAG: hypothetical protein CM1200mP39_19390 [Dehalococcoidia bacterium]|nr:MAG: hypothetical protein CM1200mP39_19390 [Dehalococcoidia bacterium]